MKTHDFETAIRQAAEDWRYGKDEGAMQAVVQLVRGWKRLEVLSVVYPAARDASANPIESETPVEYGPRGKDKR